MLTVADAREILEDIKSLKIQLTKAQDFENAATMRDMERFYMDLKIK